MTLKKGLNALNDGTVANSTYYSSNSKRRPSVLQFNHNRQEIFVASIVVPKPLPNLQTITPTR